MPYIFHILILIVLICFDAKAANGDTIKIKTHENVIIRTNPAVGHTAYTTWAVFPSSSVSIHKAVLKMSFRCPPGENCGEWDYLNYIYLRRKGSVFNPSMDIELARFITPYGNGLNQSWSAAWDVEITDFEGLLRDSVEMEYRHTGYEATAGRGWVLNMEIQLIEGPAIRPFHTLHKLWNGNFEYGNANQSINDVLQQQSITYTDSTKSARLRIIQTGHGFGGVENCAEFCSKLRTIRRNGVVLASKQVWRDNCGWNPVFPQGGTWVYDRAGWCPGDIAFPDATDFSVNSSAEEELTIQMQNYTNTAGQYANYVIESYLIEYGEPRFAIDAAMLEVIKPSVEFKNRRINPICSAPVVKVRNNGTTAITSLEIQFGTKGFPKTQFNWTGNLGFMQETEIELNVPHNWFVPEGIFEAEVSKVNNTIDEYSLNNRIESAFTKPDELPQKFVVNIKTNNRPAENAWFLKNENGITIASRTDMLANTEYRDTVEVPSGCYQLLLEDYDGDGLSWWANNDGSGFFRIRKADVSGTIKSWSGDFGSGVLYNFTVGGLLSTEKPVQPITFDVFPNPASHQLMVQTDVNLANNQVYITMTDLSGRQLLQQAIQSESTIVSVDALNSGIYILRLHSKEGTLNKKIQVLK